MGANSERNLIFENKQRKFLYIVFKFRFLNIVFYFLLTPLRPSGLSGVFRLQFFIYKANKRKIKNV